MTPSIASGWHGPVHGELLITPTDASTYLGVFSVLAMTSLLACYLPARSVSHVDPIKALRQE